MLEVYINGKKADSVYMKQLMAALNDSATLAEKGGYLFKFTVHEKTLHFGILPHFIEGDRCYHYDIKLPEEDEFTISGNIGSEGEISLLFKPREKPLSETTKKTYIATLVRFCTWIVNFGYDPFAPIDWITKKLLEEAKLFDRDVKTIRDIADQPEL